MNNSWNNFLSEFARDRRVRLTALAIVSFFVLWMGSIRTASADDRFGPPWQSMVVANQTLVYSQPDQASKVVGPLAGGAMIVVTGDNLGADKGWTQILDGYVRTSDITQLRAEWVAEVSAPSPIPIYAKPNKGQGIRRTAKPGDLLRVTGVSAGVDGDPNIWWSTTEGYVAMGTIRASTSQWVKSWALPDGTMAPGGWWGTVTSQANVRAGATTASPVVGSFGGGERVKVLATEQGETISGSNLWYVIDGGRYAGARIHSSLVKRMAPPKPNTTKPEGSSASTYIVVDRSAFSLTLVKDGKAAFVTYVALGLAGVETPRGTYSTMGKFRGDRMTSRSVKNATHSYDLPNVPFTQYYKDGGYGIHGTYWHDLFGTRESQGCINLTWADSEYLFSQTSPQVPPVDNEKWQDQNNQGTPVVIVD